MKLNIEKHSGIYTLKSEQMINAEIHDVWNYFSNPANLDALTPPDMHFEITSGSPEAMYAGQIITYRIKVLPLFRTNWLTEISHVDEHKRFIDVQLTGPYKIWHHQHIFDKTEGGVLMTDIVSFKIPFGFIGKLFSKVIKKQLFKIFRFRYDYITNQFIENLINLK
jgi:ligand-binding SRPBCC domain-containing protein